MRVPQIGVFNSAYYSLGKKTQKLSDPPAPTTPEVDTVSFGSTAKYLKKYATLPDEIKAILSPKDAIDMFKEMESIANGEVKRDKIGLGNKAKVYENPWLKNYCLVILTDKKEQGSQIVYSKRNLGDAVWCDKDDCRIQIIREFAV